MCKLRAIISDKTISANAVGETNERTNIADKSTGSFLLIFYTLLYSFVGVYYSLKYRYLSAK